MSESVRQLAASVKNLTKRFGDKTVLEHVSLDVPVGKTTVVMGTSGCGKSTLLRCMIGSLWPEHGHVELLGRDLATLDERRMDGIHKKIGVLFQSGALYNSMTVGENVALPLREHTELDDDTIAITVKIKLELVGLRQAVDLMPAQISGGMKKRAGLARAIVLDPQVLFYDEPTAGLDPVTSAEIDQLMMDLSVKLGVTSVVVTHEMASAFRIADYMVMLDSGRVLKSGPRQEFLDLRDSTEPLDEAGEIVRQFVRGDSKGPLTQRRQESGYTQDILS